MTCQDEPDEVYREESNNDDVVESALTTLVQAIDNVHVLRKFIQLNILEEIFFALNVIENFIYWSSSKNKKQSKMTDFSNFDFYLYS